MQSVVPPAYSEGPMPPPGVNTQNPHMSVSSQGEGQWQQPQSMNGCTQIVYACQPVSRTYENYKSRQSLFVGIGQIITGCLCIVFNATLIGLESQPYYYYGSYYDYYTGLGFVGHGIWGAVFFILAGSFGIGASRSKSKCPIIAFMVLSILSAVFAAVIFSLGIVGAIISYPNGMLAMTILLAILGFVGGVLAIWGSILCCMAACCCAPTASPFVVTGQQLATPVQFLPVNGTQQQAVVVLTAPASMPHSPTGYPTGYPAAYPIGYPMQLAPSAPDYQTSTLSRANNNGTVGPLMEKHVN